MDTSVRGAFLSAIVPKESRTRFLGISKSFLSACGMLLSITNDSQRLQDTCFVSWSDFGGYTGERRRSPVDFCHYGLLQIDLYVSRLVV